MPDSILQLGQISQLVQVHHERLVRIVERRIDPAILHKVDAESVVQAAYLRVIERWEQLAPALTGPPERVFACLYRIAQQAYLDARRGAIRHRRDARREEAWPDGSAQQMAMGLMGMLTTPSQAFQRRERVEIIQSVLRQLKPEDREVLELHHFDGLNHHEAANYLNITYAATLKRYARAVKRLHELWQKIDSTKLRPDIESSFSEPSS